MQPERVDMNKDLGALSGSRATPGAAEEASPPIGFDPARFRELADRCEGKGQRLKIADWADPFEDAFRLCFPRPDKIWADGQEYAEWTPEYTEWQRRQWEFYELLEASAYLSAAWALLAPHTLWAVGSMEDGPFARLCWPMPDGSYSGGYVEGHASTGAMSLLAAVLRGYAIATEAGTAATTEIGAVHEGAGPQDIAQGPSQ